MFISQVGDSKKAKKKCLRNTGMLPNANHYLEKNQDSDSCSFFGRIEDTIKVTFDVV